MFQEQSQVHHAFDAMDITPWREGVHYSMDELDQVMQKLGIGVDRSALRNINALALDAMAMDSIQQPLTTASVTTPLQFLQNWLTGHVTMITAARKVDEILGLVVAGSWEDEQIVQSVLELSGTPAPYNDLNVVPLTSYNQNFVQRSVVRFEQGMYVGRLEEYRASRGNVSASDQKRISAGLQLEIQRNATGFYGYNNGANVTYGFLNDPNLPAYTNVATVGGHTTWATKTFLEIQGDILTAFQTLRTGSQDTIDPGKTPLVLTVATSCVDYLAKTSDFGISVTAWLNAAYPNVRVVSAPQLNGANGGANVFYVHADSVQDGTSTDDGKTFAQIVPTKFQLLGVSQKTKGYEEDYSNATAGVLCKRPYAVKRLSGI